VIPDVTKALIDLIETRTAGEGDWVVATSLHGGGPEPTANKLHVCLYAIDEHAHLRNQPPVSTPTGFRRPPLMLRLQYLMAYYATNHIETQTRLARVVQVFYETPLIGSEILRPALASRVGRVSVRLRNPGSEERNQIWTALGRPMRLALYYDVDVAPIDAVDAEGWGRVDQRELRYGTVPS
jgi:hypothetical protein